MSCGTRRPSSARKSAKPVMRAALRPGAVLDEHPIRVDRAAASWMHLEVQVRAGDVTRGAGEADGLARVDLFARLHRDAALVAVPDVGAVLQRDDGAVAV